MLTAKLLIDAKSSILINEDGSYVIAWSGKYGYQQYALYQKFTSDSIKIEKNQYVDKGQSSQVQKNIELISLENKKSLVAWDQFNDAGIKSIFMKLIDFHNDILGDAIEIKGEASIARFSPSLATFTTNISLVAWEQIDKRGERSISGTFFDIQDYQQSNVFTVQELNIQSESCKFMSLEDKKIFFSYVSDNMGKYHVEFIHDYYNHILNKTSIIEKEIGISVVNAGHIQDSQFGISIATKVDQHWQVEILKYNNPYQITELEISAKNIIPYAESFEQTILREGNLSFEGHVYDKGEEFSDLMIVIASSSRKGEVKAFNQSIVEGNLYPISALSYIPKFCGVNYHDALEFYVIDKMHAQSTLETLYIKVEEFLCPPIINSIYQTIANGTGYISLEDGLEGGENQVIIFTSLPIRGNFTTNGTLISLDIPYPISKIGYQAGLEGCSNIHSDYASYKIYDSPSDEYSNTANIIILVDKFNCQPIADSFNVNIIEFGQVNLYNHVYDHEDYADKLKFKIVNLPRGDIKINGEMYLKINFILLGMLNIIPNVQPPILILLNIRLLIAWG